MTVTAEPRRQTPEQHAAALQGIDLPITFTLPSPTNRRHQTKVTLRPGVVDEDAIEMFLHSHCATLAGALHERSGWPLALVEFPREDCPDGVHPCKTYPHVGVMTPSGEFLDILGLRAPADVVDFYKPWEGGVIRTRTLAEMVDVCIFPEGGWNAAGHSPLFVSAVRYFAEVLISRAS